jgi:peptidoglycan/LPS O-acetylase OafA/YrhL
MPTPFNDRALEIDGIRGWASFSVLLYHTFHEMFTRLLPWINSAWLAPLFDGRLAVCIFFVLSGDALTTAFFARGGVDPAPVDRLVVRRYTRLTVPIVMSCSLVFVLRMLHADWHNQASDIIHRPDWLGELIDFDFSALGLVRYSLFGVYVNHTKETAYNPFLWTMSVEMIGSMLAFLTCYLWPRLRNGRIFVAAVALALFAFNSFLCLFFAGMYLGLLRTDSYFARAAARTPRQAVWLAGFAALVLLLVATYGHMLPLLFDLAMAVAFVFVLYAQRGLRDFLRGRLSTWVGDLSFPIYLVQFAVIISFESWLVMVWNAHHAAAGWLPLIGLSSVAVTLLAAWVFRQAERSMLSRLDAVILRILRRN